MTKVKVLIVDDSATIRHLLSEILSRDPGIEVVGQAPEPHVAREMIKALNPDVLTLDVEMPGMNGLEFLDRIMRLRPMPVVMVSTLTARGTEVTLDALAMGAVDYFAKPVRDAARFLNDAADELIRKVKAAASAQVRPRAAPRSAPVQDTAPFAHRVIAIGASTGGGGALLGGLAHFPPHCPPTGTTPHMPARLPPSLPARLDQLCAPPVAAAAGAAGPGPGPGCVAPRAGGHLVNTRASQWRCRLIAGGATSGHRPSVDRLFHAVAACAGPRAVGAILTGMGRDGANGLSALRANGADTIGQDEATSIVYGMPRAAQECGAVMRQLPLEKIGPEILRLCRVPTREVA